MDLTNRIIDEPVELTLSMKQTTVFQKVATFLKQLYRSMNKHSIDGTDIDMIVHIITWIQEHLGVAQYPDGFSLILYEHGKFPIDNNPVIPMMKKRKGYLVDYVMNTLQKIFPYIHYYIQSTKKMKRKKRRTGSMETVNYYVEFLLRVDKQKALIYLKLIKSMVEVIIRPLRTSLETQITVESMQSLSGLESGDQSLKLRKAIEYFKTSETIVEAQYQTPDVLYNFVNRMTAGTMPEFKIPNDDNETNIVLGDMKNAIATYVKKNRI